MDAKPFFKEQASKGHNPFGLVTHIDGKKIKTTEKKHEVAKKMKPYKIGEDMHQTFKKLGKAVGKIKPSSNDKAF